jgi:hypothetical protein
MVALLIITLIALTMTIRSLLVVIGAYKDPILASFEDYGNERIFSPMFSLMLWSLLLAYTALYWYLEAGIAVALGIMLGVPVAAFKDNFYSFLDRHPMLFRTFPRWYYELVKTTDREERRRLAYMWLRLPIKTRMIYNSQISLFKQWVEQVILTISR